MGGNVFKQYGLQTDRIHKDELYDVIDAFESDVLSDVTSNSYGIPTMLEKDSHGDVDIVIMSSEFDNINFNNPNIIKTHKNGSIRSIAYKYNDKIYHFDLIVVSPKNFKPSFYFLSLGDFSAIMGVIAARMNLKFSHAGLFWRMESFDPVYLCDYETGLKHLGIDIETWKGYVFGDEYVHCMHEDFHVIKTGITPEMMYDLVLSSKYAVKGVFDYDEMNGDRRRRLKKRKSYADFLEYAKKKGLKDGEVSWCDGMKIVEAISHDRGIDLKEIIKERWKEIEKRKFEKEVINGKVVSLATGLKNKELGDFMKWMKGSIGYSKMKVIIHALNDPHGYVYEKVKELYDEYCTEVN